jgi:cytochrome P450
MPTIDTCTLPLLPVETEAFAADPDPFLHAARRENAWLARFSQGYVVHGHDALVDLIADGENLVPGLGTLIDYYGVRGTMWARFMEEIVISRHGPEHARLRASVVHAFTPLRANRERELMQRVIGDLLDEWAPRGSFDFADFASYFPVTVICGLLGVSAEPIPRMRQALEDHMFSLSFAPDAKPRFMAAWDVLWRFADELVTAREASGERDGESLLDALIAARDEGKLDETELRFMILTIVVAGFDTSKNQLTMTMHLLLDRPEMYARCAEDKEFCGRVVDESLRHSAIATPFREAARDFTYRDFLFRKGDVVLMAPPLANRDPSAFPEPELFDPERPNAKRHLAFGRGAHICLGQFIARNQLQEGIHLIARRLRNPRRDGDIAWRPFVGAWGLRSLPIAFDP